MSPHDPRRQDTSTHLDEQLTFALGRNRTFARRHDGDRNAREQLARLM